MQGVLTYVVATGKSGSNAYSDRQVVTTFKAVSHYNCCCVQETCRPVPADDTNSQQHQQADNSAGSNANTIAATAAVSPASRHEVRLRRGHNGVGMDAGNS